jgi:plastocyanin
MSTQQIQIQTNTPPNPTRPGKFNPQAAQANAGDDITWFNQDGNAHWPTPNASNRAAWFRTPIAPGEPSDGQVALGSSAVIVTAATNANPVVFTVQGPAPATGTLVSLAFAAPADSPESKWEELLNGVTQTLATNLGPNLCSVPLNSTNAGPLDGQITISMPGAYTIKYVCALHPAETGTIVVNPQQ